MSWPSRTLDLIPARDFMDSRQTVSVLTKSEQTEQQNYRNHHTHYSYRVIFERGGSLRMRYLTNYTQFNSHTELLW
jgi:hypothetical protein